MHHILHRISTMALCRNLKLETKNFKILNKKYTKIICRKCCIRCNQFNDDYCDQCSSCLNICPCLKCSASSTSNNRKNFQVFSKLSDDIYKYISKFMDIFSTDCLRSTAPSFYSLISPTKSVKPDTKWVTFVDNLLDLVNNYNYANSYPYPEIISTVNEDIES